MGKINKELTILLILTLSVTMLTLAEAADTSQAQADANQAVSSGNYWAAEASMTVARSGLGAAAVDGKIYAIGGRNGDRILGINQQYDPTTNTWTNKAAMPTPRYDFAVTVYGGKIYCIGGIDSFNIYLGGLNYKISDVNEVYDPVTDTWTTESPMPHGSDGEANVVNDKIYVISGSHDPNSYLNQVYDPATNQWRTKTHVPDRNGWCAASAVIENKIYVIGGYDFGLSYNIVQIYDTISDSWTAGTSPPRYMGGNVAGAVTIGSLDSQKIELFGLTGYASTESNGSTANQIYDPYTDSWTVAESMPTSRQNFGLALLDNDVYVIGGSIAYLPFPGDTGGSTWYFSTNERYTLPAVIPTPIVTLVPATNSTLPTESPPKLNITTEGIAVIAVVVFVVAAVSAVFVVGRRKKSSGG